MEAAKHSNRERHGYRDTGGKEYAKSRGGTGIVKAACHSTKRHILLRALSHICQRSTSGQPFSAALTSQTRSRICKATAPPNPLPKYGNSSIPYSSGANPSCSAGSRVVSGATCLRLLLPVLLPGNKPLPCRRPHQARAWFMVPTVSPCI